MTDVDDILDNATQWATESVTKPTIKTGQLHSISLMTRGIVVQKLRSDDELVGVVDRNRYSIDSHDVWSCATVTHTSEADMDNIIGVIKRIIAEYTQVEDHETYLNWEGGEFNIWNNIRFEFYFIITRQKAMIKEF